MKKSYFSKTQLQKMYAPRKLTSISVQKDLTTAEVIKLAGILKTEEIVTLDLSSTNLSVDDLLILSTGIKECPTLKHVDLSNNIKLMQGQCKDSSIIDDFTELNIRDTFQQNTLESIKLSGWNSHSIMAPYFLSIIGSQADSLKYLDISNSVILSKHFEFVSSIKSLETIICHNFDIQLAPSEMKTIQIWSLGSEESHAQRVILKALSSKPTLHMHVDTHFISSHTFAKEIAVTSFASRVAST